MWFKKKLPKDWSKEPLYRFTIIHATTELTHVIGHQCVRMRYGTDNDAYLPGWYSILRNGKVIFITTSAKNDVKTSGVLINKTIERSL